MNSLLARGYAATVFDFDGTLADTQHAVAVCMAGTFSVYGTEPPSPETVRSTIGHTLPDSLALLGAPPDDLPAWVRTYRDLYAERGTAETSLFPGAHQVLATLAETGTKIAIVTNKGHHAVEAILAGSGIDHLPISVFAADTSRFTKPDPRLVHEQLLVTWPDLAAEDLLVVGDTATDIEFGAAAGADVCWVTYGYGDPSACRTLRPTHIVDCLTELLPLVISGPVCGVPVSRPGQREGKC